MHVCELPPRSLKCYLLIGQKFLLIKRRNEGWYLKVCMIICFLYRFITCFRNRIKLSTIGDFFLLLILCINSKDLNTSSKHTDILFLNIFLLFLSVNPIWAFDGFSESTYSVLAVKAGQLRHKCKGKRREATEMLFY